VPIGKVTTALFQVPGAERIVAFLMVFPVIWQNLYDAFSSIDRELIEVARVFEFSYKKKLKLLMEYVYVED
jgi:ABC-type nitrate/sulfonate/bicarbonate transport system permease component